jgi:hypothetical protein
MVGVEMVLRPSDSRQRIVMPQVLYVTAVLFALASVPAFAGDVALKHVYLQSLSHAVHVDALGNPWFIDKQEIRDSANTIICRVPEQGTLLLIDRAKRIWWRSPSGDLTYFDGQAWQATTIAPHSLHESAAGQLFAVTSHFGATPTLHVFNDGKWTNQRLPEFTVPGRNPGSARFVESSEGQTYFWLAGSLVWREAEANVWKFDGRKWVGCKITGLKANDFIDELIPFPNSWFLVLGPIRSFAWNPLEKGVGNRNDPFASLPRMFLKYRGVDANGVRYFRWLDRGHPDVPQWQYATDEPPFLAVSPDRNVTRLTREQGEQIGKQLWDRHNTRRVLGEQVIPFPVTKVFGKDKHGRIFVQNDLEIHGRAWVVWPAKEKVGDLVRLAANEGELVPERGRQWEGMFADDRGFAFAASRTGAVVMWNRTKWTETPIEPLPTLTWSNRAAPSPEFRWAHLRWLGYVSGNQGRTLFVRMKTQYSPIPGPEDEFGNRRLIIALSAERNSAFYHYEAWSHLGGAWSQPQAPTQLLMEMRKELIAEFQLPHTPVGPLPVISDGRRLWSACDWTIQALDANGRLHTAELPKPVPEEAKNPRNRSAPPHMLAALAKLDDQSLLLAVDGAPTRMFRLEFREQEPLGVQMKELASLPMKVVLHRATDGTVLAWANTLSWPSTRLPDGRQLQERDDSQAVYRLRDGRWEEVEAITQPIGKSQDGTLWCPARRGPAPDGRQLAKKVVLYRVTGARAERLEWRRDEVLIGFGEPKSGTATFVLPQFGLANIEPNADDTKPTLRVRYLDWSKQIESSRTVVTASGYLLQPTHHTRLFVPPGS